MSSRIDEIMEDMGMDGSFVPHEEYQEYPLEEMRERAAAFYADIKRRRTIREFSDRPVPRDIIETCLLAAGTAPSGANLQPWQFVVVSDPEIKEKIKVAAEAEEREFYNCLLYTSPSPRDGATSRMPSSA